MIKIPIYEYKCVECDNIDEKLEFGEEEINKEHFCSKCNNISKRIVSRCKFELIYDNKTDMCSWGNDGYSSSQYWNSYKAAKARGENVKPAGED